MKIFSGKFIATTFALLLACTTSPAWAQDLTSVPQAEGTGTNGSTLEQKEQASPRGEAAQDVSNKKQTGSNAGKKQEEPRQKEIQESQTLEGQSAIAADGEKMYYQDAETPVETTTVASTQEPISTTPQKQEQSSWPLWIALLAFLLSIIAICIARQKKTEKKARQPARVQRPISPTKSVPNHLDGMVRQIQSEMNSLSMRLENLEKQFNDIRMGINADNHVAPANISVPPPANGRKYASLPKNGLIDSSGLKEKSSREFFIEMEIKGNSATFTFCSDSDVQQYLLANFNFTIKSLCTVKSRADVPSRIVVMERGKMQKEGNGWRITKQPVISLE